MSSMLLVSPNLCAHEKNTYCKSSVGIYRSYQAQILKSLLSASKSISLRPWHYFHLCRVAQSSP